VAVAADAKAGRVDGGAVGDVPAAVLRWAERLDGRTVRLLLADGDDPRAVVAAEWLAAHTPVRPRLLTAAASAELAADPEVRAALGRQPTGAARDADEVLALADDPLNVAAAAVVADHADACVAGATRSTRDVIRAGIKVLGLRPGVTTVSSSFLMVMPDGHCLAYGDCGVLPHPDAGQLADVALATAQTFSELVGSEPVVAMLSFSTLGSAEHAEVDRVRAALDLVRTADPALRVDGELQFDAAVVESVARLKAPASPVAGHANVLVFPDLAAGNIGYKITERFGGATAIGPILQGLAAPFHDLSRGCAAGDIVAAGLLAAVQAHEQSGSAS